MLAVSTIKVAFDAIYEKWGDPYSVGWSIAYNFIDYAFLSASLMLAVFIIDGSQSIPSWIRKYRKIIKPVVLITSMGYWIMACIELTYINETWEVYSSNAGGGFYVAQAYTVVCAIIFYGWLYYHKKNNEVFKWI